MSIPSEFLICPVFCRQAPEKEAVPIPNEVYITFILLLLEGGGQRVASGPLLTLKHRQLPMKGTHHFRGRGRSPQQQNQRQQRSRGRRQFIPSTCFITSSIR